MKQKSYTLAQKLEALRKVDAGMDIGEVATQMGAPRNTVYVWTSAKGRKAIMQAASYLREAGEAQREAKPRSSKVEPKTSWQHVAPPELVEAPLESIKVRTSGADAETLERLTKENEFMKAQLAAYRKMTGL